MKQRMIFNQTKHKELWNWLAENPEMTVQNWPGWKERPRFTNFACMAIDEKESIDAECHIHCPLQWGSVDNRCWKKGSPYHTWMKLNKNLRYCLEAEPEDMEKLKEQIKEAAIKIANLPVRNIRFMEVI